MITKGSTLLLAALCGHRNSSFGFSIFIPLTKHVVFPTFAFLLGSSPGWCLHGRGRRVWRRESLVSCNPLMGPFVLAVGWEESFSFSRVRVRLLSELTLLMLLSSCACLPGSLHISIMPSIRPWSAGPSWNLCSPQGHMFIQQVLFVHYSVYFWWSFGTIHTIPELWLAGESCLLSSPGHSASLYVFCSDHLRDWC